MQWELGRLGEAGVYPHAHTSTAVTPHPPALPDLTWPKFSATLGLLMQAPISAAAGYGMLFKGHTVGRLQGRLMVTLTVLPKGKSSRSPLVFHGTLGALATFIPPCPPPPQSPREAGPREQSELRTLDSDHPGFNSCLCWLLYVMLGQKLMSQNSPLKC